MDNEIKFDVDLTKKFIDLRGGTHRKLFTGIRGSATIGYSTVIEALGYVASEAKIKKCQKKWDNLMKKYKECLAPKSGVGVENGEDSKFSWEFFSCMDAVLKKDHNVRPPMTISSAIPTTPQRSSLPDSDDHLYLPLDNDSYEDIMPPPSSHTTPSRKTPASSTKDSPSPGAIQSSPRATSVSPKDTKEQAKKRKLVSSPIKSPLKRSRSTLTSQLKKQGKEEKKYQKKSLKLEKLARKDRALVSNQFNAMIGLAGILIANKNPESSAQIQEILKTVAPQPNSSSEETESDSTASEED